jgi:hypothetical protein
MLIKQNPELLKRILTPERLNIIFSIENITKIMELNQGIDETVNSKRIKRS